MKPGVDIYMKQIGVKYWPGNFEERDKIYIISPSVCDFVSEYSLSISFMGGEPFEGEPRKVFKGKR